MAATPPPYTTNPHYAYSIAQQQTVPLPAVSLPPTAPFAVFPLSGASTRKQTIKRIVAIVTVLALFIIMYFIWSPPTPTLPASGSSTSQQNFGSSSLSTTTSSPSTSGSGDIQVYIVGAVKHPGVYTLPSTARVYALLQAAGGPLARANLVALNLAAALTDGEEVYVTAIGEVPPTYLGGVPGPSGSSSTGTRSRKTTGTPPTGQLVNINSASIDEMRQSLHVSSTTAQNIVNYRLQHGPYTSVDQLLQVVSKSIYDKIKDWVTV